MSFSTKVWVVQRADRMGCVSPDILAVRLNRKSAQAIAKANAPCRVTEFSADKSETLAGGIEEPRPAQSIAQAG